LRICVDLDVHDVDDLHQLLAEQPALPHVAPHGYGHLTEFFALIGRNVQTMNVVRARGKHANNFKKRSMPVLDQYAKRPDRMS
jgi:hypothetical protein